ncbi:hypothetical protein J2Y48_004553 [Mycoplana sp. BE70]|nr:hypothetical protein [Mycoplana sp. BE70]MDR6759237.1 hypothetical protein [Mycoplana sp. BE70]
MAWDAKYFEMAALRLGPAALYEIALAEVTAGTILNAGAERL